MGVSTKITPAKKRYYEARRKAFEREPESKPGGRKKGTPTQPQPQPRQPRQPQPKLKPHLQRRMQGKEPGIDNESLRDKLKWERWKIERKKQSDKPSTPLGGGIKKIGPKPGSMDYFLQETMKPGYKIPKKARGGLIKGKPKLAKRGWK